MEWGGVGSRTCGAEQAFDYLYYRSEPAPLTDSDSWTVQNHRVLSSGDVLVIRSNGLVWRRDETYNTMG